MYRTNLRSLLLTVSLLCCASLFAQADTVVLWQTTTDPSGIWEDDGAIGCS